MDISLTCRNVMKVFEGDGIKTNALEAIHIAFPKGAFVSIAGPSGSGKSTLLSLLGTLDRPTSGEIYFGEKNVSQLKSRELSDFRFQHIGFIFQQFHLLPTLTALENVMSPLIGRKGSYQKKERAEQFLEQVGLRDKANALPSQLSGGQQQRVAIARALINEPSWLLADEPTGNLDTETGEVIFELLSELNRSKGCGVIFVTHDPALANRAKIQIRMKDGRIISETRESAYV
ncbi:ABC transporter ATP-binding protein [Metabacillus sp. GX 13764]|uniref:ABC transporter ATP-binding protein n=1 Tax=Metabacillus kandeliae TaxID=2900151 RepID=UPI001E3CE40A|nr:ABC transporter ATP-binding protein [Metabacillus kandeliae]MCD7035263.1 ABC transporter ATP-binding protein [Metabacillus kandeliae]